MAARIHIFGASGSGATTLGKALAQRLGVSLVDTDDFYWKPTDPPFREKNEPRDRVAEIERTIEGVDSWLLSGSICNWGDALVGRFSLAIFLYLNPAIRLARLAVRERERFGDRIQAGGDMHEQHIAFMDWAASYETARAPVRSLDLHRRWAKRLPCPVFELAADAPVDELVEEVLREQNRVEGSL